MATRRWGKQPKGPGRTKKYYDNSKNSELLRRNVFTMPPPPYLLRREPFLEREKICNFQENSARTRCAAAVNHNAVVNSLRVENLLRVAFLVRQGPLGTLNCNILGGFSNLVACLAAALR